MDGSSVVLNMSDICDMFDETEVDGEVLLSADSELLAQELNPDGLITTSTDTTLCSYNRQASLLQGYDRKSADSSVNGSSGFHCDMCDKSFKSLVFLRMHTSHSHSTQVGLINAESSPKVNHSHASPLQGYDRKSADSSINDDPGFHCGICDKSFKSPYFLQMHKSHSHSVQLPSERIDSEESDEESHRLFREDSTMFPCDLCPGSFSRISLLRNHREEVHSISKVVVHRDTPNPKGAYYCECCNKVFVYTSQLKYHMKTHAREALNIKHNKADYPCKYCHRKFGSAYSSQKHMLKVHRDDSCTEEFNCPICSKAFSLTRLVRHVQVTHQTIPTWSHTCETCGTILKSEARLRWHHWKYHGTGLNDSDSAKQDQLKRKCLKCGMEFEASELSNHWKKSHWLACSRCNLVFVSSADREIHWVKQHGLNVASFPLSSITNSSPSSGAPLSTSVLLMEGKECEINQSELLTGVISMPSAHDLAFQGRQSLNLRDNAQYLSSEQTCNTNCMSIKREPEELISTLETNCNVPVSASVHSSSATDWSQAIHKAAAAAASAVHDGAVCNSPAITESRKRSSSLAALAARAKVLGATAERIARTAAKLSPVSITSATDRPAQTSYTDNGATDDALIIKYSSKNARRNKTNNNFALNNTMCNSQASLSSNIIKSNQQQVSIKCEPVDCMNSESEGSMVTELQQDVPSSDEMINHDSVFSVNAYQVSEDATIKPDQGSIVWDNEETIKPVACWRKADLSIYRCDKSAGLTGDSLSEWDGALSNSQIFNNSDTEKRYVCGLCGQLYEYELYVKMCYMGHSQD